MFICGESRGGRFTTFVLREFLIFMPHAHYCKYIKK